MPLSAPGPFSGPSVDAFACARCGGFYAAALDTRAAMRQKLGALPPAQGRQLARLLAALAQADALGCEYARWQGLRAALYARTGPVPPQLAFLSGARSLPALCAARAEANRLEAALRLTLPPALRPALETLLDAEQDLAQMRMHCAHYLAWRQSSARLSPSRHISGHTEWLEYCLQLG